MIADTNALSAFLAGDASVAPAFAEAADLCLPVIVLGEYRYGMSASRESAALETALDELCHDVRVLPVDSDTARFYAVVRRELRAAGTPIPENDVWIAALARQHDLPVLSNDAHFDCVEKLRRIGW